MQTGRSHLQDIELTFLPDMEVIEVTCSNRPKLWIARDQVFSMEPEQDAPAVAVAGPVAHADQPAPEPVAVEAPKALEGARDSYSAPAPDLRPPPKNEKHKHDAEGRFPKPDKFAKIGKKRGRPKKVK